jgi:hypothetical protein
MKDLSNEEFINTTVFAFAGNNHEKYINARNELFRRLNAGEEAIKKVAELKQALRSSMNELLKDTVSPELQDYFDYVSELRNKIAELEKELFDIKSKTFCAYCGFEIAIDNDAPLKIEAHIFECKKHPVCILSKRIAELEKEVERLKEKLLIEEQKQNESYRVPYLEKEVELLKGFIKDLKESNEVLANAVTFEKKQAAAGKRSVEAIKQIDKVKINHSRYDEYVDAVRDIVINCLHKEAL